MNPVLLADVRRAALHIIREHGRVFAGELANKFRIPVAEAESVLLSMEPEGFEVTLAFSSAKSGNPKLVQPRARRQHMQGSFSSLAGSIQALTVGSRK